MVSIRLKPSSRSTQGAAATTPSIVRCRSVMFIAYTTSAAPTTSTIRMMTSHAYSKAHHRASRSMTAATHAMRNTASNSPG